MRRLSHARSCSASRSHPSPDTPRLRAVSKQASSNNDAWKYPAMRSRDKQRERRSLRTPRRWHSFRMPHYTGTRSRNLSTKHSDIPRNLSPSLSSPSHFKTTRAPPTRARDRSNPLSFYSSLSILCFSLFLIFRPNFRDYLERGKTIAGSDWWPPVQPSARLDSHSRRPRSTWSV